MPTAWRPPRANSSVGTNTLTITTASLPTGQTNVAYSFQPQISGGTAPFTWTVSGLPRGITANSSNGLISGTTGFGGSYSVTISVTDSSSTPQTASAGPLTLLIGTPQLSFVTPAALPNAPIGMPYSVQIVATGGILPYNWSANTTATTFPSWLTFDLSGQGACQQAVTFCGTPPTLGNFSFTVTVIDSGSSTITQTFTGTVTPVTGLGALAVANTTIGQGLEVPVAITFTPVVGPTSGATTCPDGPGTPVA